MDEKEAAELGLLPGHIPTLDNIAQKLADDIDAEIIADYDIIQPVTRSIVRNLTTSHKQHHTAPDGRRYVDTGKGWRRV